MLSDLVKALFCTFLGLRRLSADRVRWFWLLTILLPLTGWAGDPSDPCRPMTFEGAAFTVCTLDASAHDVRLYWRNDAGEPYAQFGRIPAQVNGADLVFAMNAGMYLDDLSPAGLYIEQGEVLRRANNADGPGNFHMKPNGVLLLDAQGDARVMTTEAYLRAQPQADYATQSGPMLVIDGELHPRFIADSTSLRRRNGVGVCQGGTPTFVISERPVNFHRFARLFRDRLDCDNALYLDGTMSSLHAPGDNRSDFIRPMGPIVAAYLREGREASQP